MAREISLPKAKKVLKEFRESNFNATNALVKAGYSQNVAAKGSKKVINNAIRKVAKEEMAKIVESGNPSAMLLQTVGMTPGELINEFMFIVKQNKDLTNKLKALQPLLATQGIKWNEEQTLNAPQLNITVKQNDKKVIDTDKTAQPSHIEDSVAQYVLSDAPSKDGHPPEITTDVDVIDVQ